MSLVLNVEILGEFKKLTAATQGASKQLSGLSGTASKISSSIGKAFGAIGLGIGFAVITRELKEAAKAAVQDAKSQGLLANALENTAGATKSQIAQVEKSILKMSIQAAVADDQIRPAFAKLVRATGSVAGSTKLMSLALDVSAGTGKNLDAVVNALSKAVGPDGTTGALERLVPAIKDASDPLAVLETLFEGSAEKAANLDPYQRLNVVFGEISESIGTLLVPLVESFARALTDALPYIQRFFEDVRGALDNPIVKDAFGKLETSLGELGASLLELFGISETKEANGFLTFFFALATTLDYIVQSVNLVVKAFKDAMPIFKIFSDLVNRIVGGLIAISGYKGAPALTGNIKAPTFPTTSGRTSTSSVTINVNNPNMTATDIVRELNRARQANGQLGLIN